MNRQHPIPSTLALRALAALALLAAPAAAQPIEVAKTLTSTSASTSTSAQAATTDAALIRSLKREDLKSLRPAPARREVDKVLSTRRDNFKTSAQAQEISARNAR